MDAPPTVYPPLRVEAAATERNELVIRVSGELDLLTHGTLRSALDSLPTDGAGVVRVQLGQLRFCDSRGLCMLMNFVKAARREGHDVVIEGASPIVRKLMPMFAA